MAPKQKKGRSQQPESSLLGSMHISTSNVLSYSLVTGAAMLAFFFAFQATLIGYFSNFSNTFGVVTFKWNIYQIPIGKICVTLVCAMMFLFTIWSLKMVRMTIDYIAHIIESGAALEAKIGNLDFGVFSVISANRERRNQHSMLSSLTAVICWVISFLWLVTGALVWV